MSNKIGIVGAGLVGSLLGLSLKKKGFDVSLYEKRADPRKVNQSAGRSINLALSQRGIRPLKEAGVFDKIAPYLIPMHGRMMHDVNGEKTFQPYGKEGQFINSVSRAQLNELLIEASEEEGVDIHFEHQCQSMDLDKTTITFDNGKTINPDLILGTDGAFSAVRKHMQISDRFNYSQHYIEHGYKELNMEPINGDFGLEPNYLHIWPRGNFMLIALPNADKTFTCTLFFPFEGKVSFSSLHSREKVAAFFEDYFPDIIPLIPDLLDQYEQNPTSSLVTVRCTPWNKGDTLILGDAAHAIVPFYGQGMNSGFEDVRLLMDTGDAMDWEWKRILPHYASFRKKDADAIADLALYNFIEMRDHVGSQDFLDRKKLEAEIQAAYPEDWIPLYSMVTFSEMPYSEALHLGKLQRQVLDEFAQEEQPNFAKIIDRFNTLRKGA